TCECAWGGGSVGRFDQFAAPWNAAFTGGASLDDAASNLWPTEEVATRGSIKDTFGTATTPAAVVQGQPLTLVIPAGADDGTVVNLEPLGQVPTSAST